MMLENELRHVPAPNPTSGPAEVVSSPETTAARRPSTDLRVVTLLANARVLRRHGEVELALNLLREASNRDSKNSIVLSALAETLESAGRDQEALVARRAQMKADYGLSTVFRVAQVSYRLGNDEEALQLYYEALSITREEDARVSFEIHKNMGNIFTRRNDLEGAEECYNKAYALNADSDVLMVNLGTLEVQRGDLARSLACFRRAVDLNPRNDRAWTGLAMVHQQFGDHELAWGNLDRALDLNPSNRTAVHLAAHWAMRDKCPQRAVERMENYIASVDSDEEMSLVLVNLFCASGRLDLASLETHRILAWNPAHADVRDLQKRLALELGA